MARTRKPAAHAVPLTAVPKRGRDAIARIMGEWGGQLPLLELLARNWNYWSATFSEPKQASRAAEVIAELLRQHPDWSLDQAQTALSYPALTMDVREIAIARRFTLGDHGELGIGLALLGRLRWLKTSISGIGVGFDRDTVLDAFAVCDLDAIRLLAHGEPLVCQAASNEDLGFHDLFTLALAAVWNRDDAVLRDVVGRIAAGKLAPWQQGILIVLAGLVSRQPTEIVAGLVKLLDGMRRLRRKDELEEAVCLWAHGLYRLCEWVSPDLVAEFPTTSPLPWDAGFHVWCNEHPDPLAGIDLTGVSHELHDAVVQLRLPAWWGTPTGR